MKNFILSAGRKIRKMAQSGRNRCGRFFSRGNKQNNIDVTGDEGDVLQQASELLKVEGTELSGGSGRAGAQTQGGAGAGGGDTRRGQQKSASGSRSFAKPPQKKWSLDEFPVTPEPGKSRFHDYDIPLPVMQAIAALDFRYCSLIQEKAMGPVLDGQDLVGKANTGTGKTAVFLIAIFSRLLAENSAAKRRTGGKAKGNVRALVLAPTRELVAQICKDGKALARFTNLSVQPVYGGVDYQKQLDSVQGRHCDLIVATPGRLLDFIGKGAINLCDCSILVLDEADRMLDMGFIPDVRRIVGRLPEQKERQTMLFSATVPDDVKRLAAQWCRNPVVVEAEPEQVAVDTVEQVVYLATADEKFLVLVNLILSHPDDRIIVFANMKNETRRLADRLQKYGIDCVLLSGDVAQNKRMSRLERFRRGGVKVLVATDVAGRGIHIEGITMVVNFTLPYEPEDYVHRIGRTGRAGASGKAVSFACEEGAFYLPPIEEYIGRSLECEVPAEALLQALPQPVSPSGTPKKGEKGQPRKTRGGENRNSTQGNGAHAAKKQDGTPPPKRRRRRRKPAAAKSTASSSATSETAPSGSSTASEKGRQGGKGGSATGQGAAVGPTD